jgi:hypothetical protein
MIGKEDIKKGYMSRTGMVDPYTDMQFDERLVVLPLFCRAILGLGMKALRNFSLWIDTTLLFKALGFS